MENTEQQKARDPFSPLELGLPVVVTDTEGNRIGNVWSPSQDGLGDAMRATTTGGASKVYFDTKLGKFTNAPISTMDYSDGKIKLNVSNDVANADWYKKLVDSDTFKSLAKLYAQDPTGKTELELDDGSKKTINDLLKGYAEDIAKYSEQYQHNVDLRTNISRLTDGALTLTDDDLVIMSNADGFSRESVSDSNAVFLPDSVKSFFEDYETFNAESGTLSAGDFYKNFYYLDSELPDSAKEILDVFGKGQLGDDREALQDIGESDKDYAIDLVRLRVSQEMNEIVERLTFYKDDLTDTEKAYYATEYAKCFSLYKTMTKDQPDSTTWTGFNIGVQNIALGVGDQVVTGVESAINFISGIIGGIGEAVVGTFAAMDGVFSFLGDVINNFSEGGFDKVNENFVESLNKVNESVERATGNGSMVDEYKQSVSELSQAIQNRQDLAAYLFEDAEYEMTLVYSNAAAMQQIGRFAGFIINQILITNPIGNAVGNAVSMGIANGAAVMTTGKTFSMLANMANVSASIAATATKASEATKYMKLLNQIGNVAKVAGFSANVYAQGVVDTFLENPALVDAMLTGATDKEIAEFQETLRWNVLWNGVGEFAPFLGKGGRKAMKGFVNTKAGAITQAFARKAFNRVTLRGRKIYEGIAEFMTRNVPEEAIEQTDAVTSATKKLNSMKRMQNLREDIIKVQEEIKNTKLFTGDGSWTENAKSIDDLIQKRIESETKLGITKKLAVAEGKNKIVKNAGLDVETANISEQTAELTMISKKMKQTNLPGSFSKETGDYINDLYNRQLLEAKEKALASKGGLSKKEAEAFQTLKDRIAKYESSIPSEYATAYKTAVQNYMEAQYRFYDKLYDFLSSDAGGNILTKEELARMRGGLYGAKYMRVQAVNFKGADDLADLLTNPSKVVEQGKVKMGDERFNRKTFSSDTTYLDPNYARDYVLTDYAEKLVGAERADAIVRAGRATSFQTDADGKILKTSKDISKAKKDLYKELEQLFSSSLKENTENLGKVTADSTAKKIKSFWSRAKSSAQREVKEILGLDTKGLKTYASTLNSEEIQQIANVYSMPTYSRKIRTVADLNSMYESLSPAQKKIVDKAMSGEELSLKRWNDTVTNNNLDVKLSRQYIKDNNAIIQSPYYKDMVAKAREKSLNEEEALALRESRLKIDEAETEIEAGKEGVKKAEEKVQGEFKKTVRRTVTESVDATAEALIGSDNPYLAALIREYEKAGVSSDLAKEYIIYQWLYDNIEKGGVVQHIAFDYYSAPSKVSEIKASTDAAMGYSKNFRNAAESIIESKLNKVIAQVQEEGVEGLVDMESTVARTTKYLEDIADMYGKHQIVEVWDKVKGDYAYYQVDRSTYNLVMNYPTFQKNNLVSRTMARINSISRIGQITLRMASLVTQGFKDSFNAVILGGWDTLLRDDPTAYKKLAEYIGQDTIDAFRKEMTPDAWKSFLAQAEWDGLSVAEAIAKSEVNNDLLMAKIKGVGTSSSYFNVRNLYNEAEESLVSDTWAKNKGKWQAAYERGDKAIQKMMGWYDKTMDTVSDKVNFLHNARENFLRKQVYRQNFMDALASGKSLNQARNYAQYVMENATTNFSRGVAWGQNIVRSIPYFGAMLNGASSMIRLLEIDPVGVMMRFTTDIVIPVTGLTVMSLQNEKDAEIYKNIPEWEKEQNLHWVIDGRTYTVPLPEELSKFILPIRHAVESMHDANDHAWGELLVNDLLNMPTIPLNAIMMLDEDYINGDPTVADRLSALALDMFNTLAPTAARTAYIAQTGRDPYTGKQYDRTKLFKDANGEYQYMTTTEYDFCQDLANFFKGWGWEINPLMAQGLLNSLLGTGSLDLIEGIRDFASQAQQGEANFAAIIEPSLAKAGNVLTGTTLTDERKAELVWYGLARELKDSKTQLLAPDGKLAKYAQDIDKAKTSSEQAKALEFYNAEVRNFQNSVMDKVKNYNAQYGDFFNRYKFASTISYLTANLTIDKIKDSTSYYDARADAVDAMYDAGFRGASDYSVFGYANRNWNTGEVTFEYADPLVVSLTQNKLYYQGDDALRKIEEAIDYSGLKDEYNNEFYPAYSKALDKKDWATANRLAADWDVKVIKEIKPIIDSYTVGELLNKSTVIDYLDNYIKVPSTTEGMGKGRYYSSKTGLNKNRGYAQSYIKKVYKYLQEKE